MSPEHADNTRPHAKSPDRRRLDDILRAIAICVPLPAPVPARRVILIAIAIPSHCSSGPAMPSKLHTEDADPTRQIS
jgi:hypothetical protein